MYIGKKSVFLGTVALVILGMIMGYTYILLTDMFRNEERIGKRIGNEDIQGNKAGSTSGPFEPLAAVPNPQTTSQGTTFIFERMYKLCGHNAITYRSATPQEIGLSQEDIESMYNTWEVKEFSPSIVWLCEKVEGYCPNHYIIKDNQGCIAIYRPLENGEGLYLVRQTDIDTGFLNSDMQERVREGWVVDSLEQVEQLVESLGS